MATTLFGRERKMTEIVKVDLMRNIRRPEQYEPLFKRFTETPHPVSGKPIFVTLRDFLCFVADLIGSIMDIRITLDGKTIETG